MGESRHYENIPCFPPAKMVSDRPVLQGKGANTPFILESRGLQRAETMSSLLERNTDIKDLMNRGELVPDTMVGFVCSTRDHAGEAEGTG